MSSKATTSSVITVIVTIILALVVLSFGLGMVGESKPVHSVKDLIKMAWEHGKKEEEGVEAGVCPEGTDPSDEITFVVRKGDVSNHIAQNRIITNWRCDVPGGDGECIITKLERYEEVKSSVISGAFQLGFFEFRLSKNANNVNYDSGDDGHCVRSSQEDTWSDYHFSKDIGIAYQNEDKITLEGYFQTIRRCIIQRPVACAGEGDVEEKCRIGGILGGLKAYKRHGYDHAKYEFNFTYQYCCPSQVGGGWYSYDGDGGIKNKDVWNDLNSHQQRAIEQAAGACCSDNGCTNLPDKEFFATYCANGLETNIMEKDDCGVTGNDCREDTIEDSSGMFGNAAWKGCTALEDDFGNLFGNYDSRSICLDELQGESGCRRAGKTTGQCLRLNFEDNYGSRYIEDLWFRSDSNDGHDNLYVFAGTDDGTEIIAENVEGYQVLNHIYIGKKVKWIDICPEHESRNHKIAWVKFTSNETFEEAPPPEEIECDSCESCNNAIRNVKEDGGEIILTDDIGTSAAETDPYGSTMCIKVNNRNGITIDCNGKKLETDSITWGINIQSSDNIEMKNCQEISGFDIGITLSNSDQIKIKESKITDNDYGIAAERSEIVLEDSEVCNNGNDFMNWGGESEFSGSGNTCDNPPHGFSCESSCPGNGGTTTTTSTTTSTTHPGGEITFCANSLIEKEFCDCYGEGCRDMKNIDSNCGDAEGGGYGDGEWDNDNKILCLEGNHDCCDAEDYGFYNQLSLGQCLNISFDEGTYLDKIKIRGDHESQTWTVFYRINYINGDPDIVGDKITEGLNFDELVKEIEVDESREIEKFVLCNKKNLDFKIDWIKGTIVSR